MLLDVDGTLYYQTPLRALMALELAWAAAWRPKRTLKQARLIGHYRSAQEWLRAYENRELRPDSQLRRAAATSGASPEEILACVREWMEVRPGRILRFCVRRSLKTRIESWSRLGVPMAVYSDYPAGPKLRSLGLQDLLSDGVCSTDPEVRAFKPAPRGFEIAAGRLGLTPREVAYIGDREDVDGAGAKGAGMVPVLLGRRRQDSVTVEGLDSWLRETYSERRASCWICGSQETVRFRESSLRSPLNEASVRITDSDYGQTAALARCRVCRFVFANPAPGKELLDLYRQMEDPEYQAGSGARRRQMRGILQTVLARSPGAASLLDVGAGTGLMVAEALALGLRAEGVEPSRWAVETASKKNDVRLFCGTLEECRDRLTLYDIVLLIDVVEHVTDPLRLIREAARYLSARGVLVLVTPDIASVAARLLGSRWWHCRPGHVGYFSRRSMNRALQESGLECLAVTGARWRFPLGYVLTRLERYAVLGSLRAGLRRAARSRWAAEREISLRLGDSKVFLARKPS